MTTLTKISDKLMELSDHYTKVYPNFYLAELSFTFKKAQIMMSQEVTGLASQALREAEALRILSLTDEYVTYNQLKPEIDVINRQTWIYTELAKNVRASQWEGGKE